ncbi:pollen receptor-like kinase 3 [Diospyros lotus]|uniref:pollen receptor-like kinase 3 n=1 Tax=Diospyros lotus TaxID=55363 RepID=UPI0022552C04|nr:pollen receptor-like kinase 3 [Diospyros lotus]
MAAVRFLLLPLLLFFSLPLSLSATDAETLIRFRNSLSNSQALDSWTPNTSPCDTKQRWAGVVCNKQGDITGLNLGHMDLSGKIDVNALLQLPALRTISFVRNSFSGPIPQFNRLGSLKALYLSFNGFSGEIPSDFFSKMGSLKKLWLSGNKFSGKLPESLGKMPNLKHLHLEENEFSGPIPPLEQQSLTSIDLSNNKLEGEVPSALAARFGKRPFQGNQGLCGKALGKECSQSLLSAARDTPEPKEKSMVSLWVVIAIVAATAVVVVMFIVARKEEDESVDEKYKKPGKENLDEGFQKRPSPSTNMRSIGISSSMRGGSSRRSSMKCRDTSDLVVVNEERGIFGFADLMKASAEVLGNGELGSSYKAVMGNGVAVVVKRMKETNKIGKDTFDAEMRRLGKLRNPNILTPLAYHFRKEEKLVVTEYAPKGSLFFVLHGDRGISHAELNWPTRLKIIKGIARGLGFLHAEFPSIDVPHGNLKSCNILLDSTYEPLLSDYAFYPLINNSGAVRSMFAFKSPEAVLNQLVSPKSDVYCFGIVVLEIITGKFPSQYGSGGTDVVQWARSAVAEKRERELIDPEIVGTNSVAEMEKLLRLGASCTESNVNQRIDMAEAIRRVEEVQA